jgi:hypothetical protein
VYPVLVYIAGPISKGDLRENVRKACDAGIRLIKAGIPCIIPHLTCYSGQTPTEDGLGVIPEVLPRGTVINDWYGLGLMEVRRCDAVLRLFGESAGADLETAEATRLGKQVFHSIDYLISWVQTNYKKETF